MKKIVLIFTILVLGVFNSIAQPNGGFENWTQQATYENPDGWATLNFLSLTVPPNPLSVFKVIGIDKHSGNYAMKVTTIGVVNNPAPDLIGDTAGGIFTGSIILSPFSYVFGFPYAGRPEKLVFWAKSAPIADDSAETLVVLLKNNGITRDTIAIGRITIPPTTEYTKFLIDLNYYSTSISDTASIVFGASKYKGKGMIGSTLYVDDIEFTGWVGIDEKNQFSNKVKTFPNPARESLTIVTEIKTAEKIRVIDVAGKSVGLFKIQNYNTIINTGLFTEGIYFYEIIDKNEKVLTNGKFNLVK
ncbi:MAG: PCMD domain-containing protein [Bacteroidetes bacterium]|nr:PCMD domain-containing protein [Bacteroidota bacterium]